MSSRQNDILLLFTRDGICHVPISGASYRKALHPYAPPFIIRRLDIIIYFKQLVGREGFEPPKTRGRQIYSLFTLTTCIPTHLYPGGDSNSQPTV